MHYVRPGAVRIEAGSSDSNLRVLAFTHDEKITVVLINGSGSRAAAISNLPVGTYAICQSVGGAVYQELGLQTVVASRGRADAGVLSVNVPSNAVMTIYPHEGVNRPPTVTGFKADPDYLSLSTPGRSAPSTTRLSVSATDPERDLISYAWSVTSQPADANVSLTAPDSAATLATGLTAAGQYVFTAAVSDGTNAVTRDIVLNVFADNQPPTLVDVHNRLPVMVTLPTDSTTLRCSGLDPNGDPISHWWTVKSAPVGAWPQFSTQGSSSTTVTCLNVPGVYVFTLSAVDRSRFTKRDVTVTVLDGGRS
jgi:hypothetical protein